MVITETFQNGLMLSEDEKKQGFWVQDDVHASHPVSPLFASFMVPAFTEGTKQAFTKLRMPLLQFRIKIADGRIYQENVPYPGDLQQRLKEHQDTINPLMPIQKKRMQDLIDNELLPFYRRMDDYRRRELSLPQAKEKVMELFDFYRRAWQIHFEIVMARSAFIALENLYGQLTGEANTGAVYNLLAGVMNKSLETDRELWKLANLAKQSAETAAIFADSSNVNYKERLAKSVTGRAFMERLQDLLETYGYRCLYSHEFADETWVENPEYALRIIAAYMQKNYDFDREFEQIIKEREIKTVVVLAKMPDGESKQTFETMLGWALDSWGVDEDHHFYIDAMLPAKARLFLLNIGGILVKQGVISEKGDIFFLYLDEVLDALSHPLPFQEKVEQRKSEHESNKLKQVPPFYGTPPQEPLNPVLERVFGGKPAEILENERTFCGYAASQGVYTGPVKIVRGPEDFAEVKHGDILVCKTIVPPWTVLFSVVGAIVTDSGGILSHAGTVAREYKLPAVVGTKLATSLLKDGDKVTVDGTLGVVHFGQS